MTASLVIIAVILSVAVVVGWGKLQELDRRNPEAASILYWIVGGVITAGIALCLLA